MLLPLDTIAVLMYLGLVAYSGSGILSDNLWDNPTGGRSLALMTLTCLITGFLFALGWNTLLRYLLGRSNNPRWRHTLSGAGEIITRLITVGLFIALTEASSWPISLATVTGLPVSELSVNLLGVLPFLVLSLAVWFSGYKLHVMMYPGAWTRWSFLLHRARYTFFILGMWVPVTLLLTGLEWSAQWWESLLPPLALRLLVYGILAAGIWIFPAFLKRFWGARPLPDGPLRERILNLQKKAGVRFSEICLWDLGGGALMNAAAVGVFAPFRYLFLSRALLARLSDEEVDAVIGHEMGHVRHNHLLFYAAVTFAVMDVAQRLLEVLPVVWQTVGLLGFLILYVRFVFGFISRRFERQADLASAEIMGTSLPLRTALEKIGLAYGNIRNAKSWHHIGIAERVQYLLYADIDPIVCLRHNRAVHRMKREGYVLVLCWVIWSAWQTGSGLDELDLMQSGIQSQAGQHISGGLEQSELAHWRRVRMLIPDSAEASLRLAEILQNRPDTTPSHKQMVRLLAEEALRNASTTQEIMRAQAILQKINQETKTEPIP